MHITLELINNSSLQLPIMIKAEVRKEVSSLVMVKDFLIEGHNSLRFGIFM